MNPTPVHDFLPIQTVTPYGVTSITPFFELIYTIQNAENGQPVIVQSLDPNAQFTVSYTGDSYKLCLPEELAIGGENEVICANEGGAAGLLLTEAGILEDSFFHTRQSMAEDPAQLMKTFDACPLPDGLNAADIHRILNDHFLSEPFTARTWTYRGLNIIVREAPNQSMYDSRSPLYRTPDYSVTVKDSAGGYHPVWAKTTGLFAAAKTVRSLVDSVLNQAP